MKDSTVTVWLTSEDRQRLLSDASRLPQDDPALAAAIGVLSGPTTKKRMTFRLVDNAHTGQLMPSELMPLMFTEHQWDTISHLNSASGLRVEHRMADPETASADLRHVEPVRRTVWLTAQQRQDLIEALQTTIEDGDLPEGTTYVALQDALAQLLRAQRKERISLRLVAGYNTGLRMPEDAIPVRLSDSEALAAYLMPLDDHTRRLLSPHVPERGWRLPPLYPE